MAPKGTIPGQLVKKLPKCPRFLYNKGNGGVFMEQWRKDARKDPIIIDIDSLVPTDHLLRKIEKVMDYEWLYERLDPYYCHDNGSNTAVCQRTPVFVRRKQGFFDRLRRDGKPSLRSIYTFSAWGS